MIVNKQNKENNLTTFVIKVFDKKYVQLYTYGYSCQHL